MLGEHKMMNKKAQIFALGMTIAVFLLCGWALFRFITAKTGVADMFNSPAKIIELNQEKEKFEFYARESAKLAIAEAYQEIADTGKFAGSECTVESDYINFCSLALNIDEELSFLVGNRINKLISNYPNADFNKIIYTVSIKDKQINFNSDKLQLRGSAEGTFGYSFAYDFNPSFLLSFDEVSLHTFQEIHAKANECSSKENIVDCMSKLQNFDTWAKKSDDKIYFDLQSKKGFFIDDSYKNIEVKFTS